MDGSDPRFCGEAVSYSPMVLSPEVWSGERTNPRWTATGSRSPFARAGTVVRRSQTRQRIEKPTNS